MTETTFFSLFYTSAWAAPNFTFFYMLLEATSQCIINLSYINLVDA